MKQTIKAKFISLNILIILPMLAIMILVIVDQYNLVNVKRTVLNDSYLAQIYLSDYFTREASQKQEEK